MHPMLNKNAAALLAVPEPVVGRQSLIGGVVFKIGVEQFPQRFALNQLLDFIEHGIVALHQVRDQQAVLGAGERNQFFGVFEARGERLLHNHMLARLQRHLRLRVVQKRGRGDVDDIDFRHLHQRFYLNRVGDTEASCARNRLRAVRACHRNQAHALHLREMLQGE
ncbi:hypothetical protein HRbin14_02187 [bacterium HR14]|nr:hypothetical protein HRbin14_02187 [bacterium HR14]